MPITIPNKKVGDIVVLYPEGRLTGLASGPLKTIVQEFLDEGIRKFIINLKKVISIDSAYAASINSVNLNVQRHDGKLFLCDAGNDVIPWLEKYAPNVIIYKDEEIAMSKLGAPSEESYKGKIAVVGSSDIARELFRGISNYKGLVFHYFDDPIKNIDKVIELKPKGIILNIELGSLVVEPLRRWRFHDETKQVPIILFGPGSYISVARALIKEGASDYVEVTYKGPQAMAYLNTLEFRNILAKKLDMIIEGAYKDLDQRKTI